MDQVVARGAVMAFNGKALIAERFALDQGVEAMARAAERGVMKVLLEP